MNDKKVALVTGGMGGLGTAICQKLHAAGFQVVTTYSPGNDRFQHWIEEQKDAGFRFTAYQTDAADFDSCAAAVERVLTDLGRVDVLVNNAGITRDQSMRKMELGHWSAVMAANLDSLFNMSKQVLEPMLARKWGRIINISSVNAQKGAFGQCNYAAAKAGMHGFTKSLALEVARHGVTVNTVSPGYLRTKMVTAVPADIMESKILPQIPMGRLGEPEEVAALVAYLASEEAAFVTGANIAINGGQHMS
ncbi:acetoacetyl-CoA reductase [Janthinobacterium agaricidamnosum]|uniref:Acetoacetyl-CoA reductase n=1 Tax=Janthinobacterium agaricidamnosum NBRC 102515 = DSM 9628 TaxID=1349767 RepID=W0V8V1_9BURK|nr:acetoacetyl-CoA reductase [Janthinobacterium agaricidamnosum]CDG84311.1 acetoacetyl-CoA reductase [Janthinobacterium agaricidamnosum NBRC 102515 = DSM 9628]